MLKRLSLLGGRCLNRLGRGSSELFENPVDVDHPRLAVRVESIQDLARTQVERVEVVELCDELTQVSVRQPT